MMKLTFVLLALLSRFSLLIIQFLANVVLPDHIPDVFNPPQDNDQIIACQSIGSRLTLLFISGLNRWDAIYFKHLMKYGYTYENSLAFFPLFPALSWLMSRTLLYPFQCFMCYDAVLLCSATVVNLIAFAIATVQLYQLTYNVLQHEDLAIRSSLLFCINPASIFMVAPYTESLFACLTFSAMNAIQQKKFLKGSMIIALCCLTRSNGVVLIGFLALRLLKTFNLLPYITNLLVFALWVSIYFIISLVPFIWFQYYAYSLYCTKTVQIDISKHLLSYGQERGYKMPIDDMSPWCYRTIPLSYSYVQNSHWQVGFLAYYQVKQIPNFLLALPMILLCVATAMTFKPCWRHCKHYMVDRMETSSDRMIPYLAHMVVLFLVAIPVIHIQVLTRLITPATPTIYWFAAVITNKKNSLHAYEQRGSSREQNSYKHAIMTWKYNPLMTDLKRWRQLTLMKRSIYIYFLGYAIVGTVAFANFFPWT